MLSQPLLLESSDSSIQTLKPKISIFRQVLNLFLPLKQQQPIEIEMLDSSQSISSLNQSNIKISKWKIVWKWFALDFSVIHNFELNSLVTNIRFQNYLQHRLHKSNKFLFSLIISGFSAFSAPQACIGLVKMLFLQMATRNVIVAFVTAGFVHFFFDAVINSLIKIYTYFYSDRDIPKNLIAIKRNFSRYHHGLLMAANIFRGFITLLALCGVEMATLSTYVLIAFQVFIPMAILLLTINAIYGGENFKTALITLLSTQNISHDHPFKHLSTWGYLLKSSLSSAATPIAFCNYLIVEQSVNISEIGIILPSVLLFFLATLLRSIQIIKERTMHTNSYVSRLADQIILLNNLMQYFVSSNDAIVDSVLIINGKNKITITWYENGLLTTMAVIIGLYNGLAQNELARVTARGVEDSYRTSISSITSTA